ncbi:MAG: hypothetical protein BroJett003_08610 [Planctomycetota bacterium]|nr:MAG: hypothetical protein BroJett003_08610 [Planctomycetota bacterium]
MTQMQPPAPGPGMPTFQPPPFYGVQPDRPWSGAAITAFISSFLVCCPVINVIVALICGFIGIANTSGGRAKGRVLAILAIPISLLTGAGEGFLGYVYYRMFEGMMGMPIQAAKVFDVSSDQLDENATAFYEKWASADLKSNVSSDEFRAWAKAVHEKTGRLIEANLEGLQPGASTPPAGAQEVIIPMNLNAKFTNGAFIVSTDLYMNPANFPDMLSLNDVTIADLNLRDFGGRGGDHEGGDTGSGEESATGDDSSGGKP